MTDEPLISTKDRPGDYDAFETAKEGEPILTFQGGDPFAPPAIFHWVNLFRAAAEQEPNDEKREAMLRKATSAEAVGWAMQAYYKGHVPVEEPRASYQARTPDPVTDRNGALARLADRVYNSVAEMAEVADKLEAMQPGLGGSGDLASDLEFAEPVAAIATAVRILKRAVGKFEPRRHLQGERA